MNKKKKKENPFTTIQLLKTDREKLFSLAMDIKEFNNDKEPPCPYQMIKYAIEALEAEVGFFRTLSKEEIKQYKKTSTQTLH
tara:strand:+ start:160 stop:405 length:246 start_codon:yes stop_codon:yes gene_type:complete